MTDDQPNVKLINYTVKPLDIHSFSPTSLTDVNPEFNFPTSSSKDTFAELTNAPNFIDESIMAPMSETEKLNEKIVRETVESLENLELQSVPTGRNAGLERVVR